MASRQGIERLTAREVQTAKADVSDGGGLAIRVPRGRDGVPSWVFRYTAPDGRRRELGLGVVAQSSISAAGESVRLARKAAAKAREQLRDAIDPIEHAKALRQQAQHEAEAARLAARAERTTLRRCARRYHEEHVEPVRTVKHGRQWIASIEGPPADARTSRQRSDRKLLDALLDRPIDSIEPIELLDALVPLCRATPETGFRVYQRLALIFDAAILARECRLNPALPIRRELARRVGRRERGNFAAMDWRRLPAFIERLRAAEGTAPRCLEWLIVTASRTAEALGCEWSEIDLERREWRVPAGRMKLREEHVVYLSDRALAILAGQRELHPGARYVFPSVASEDGSAPQSNMALAMCLRRLGEGEVTVHGFRSAFSTWAAEAHAATPDVVECALAHKEQDRIRRAYMRGAFIEQRRALMDQWSAFLAGGEVPASNVVEFGRRRAA
jgi:integrase